MAEDLKHDSLPLGFVLVLVVYLGSRIIALVSDITIGSITFKPYLLSGVSLELLLTDN